MSYRLMIQGVVCRQVVSSLVFAQRLSREQRDAPPVSASHQEGVWIVEGRQNKVTLHASDLTMSVVVETSADAAYTFTHPAGGRTVIGLVDSHLRGNDMTP
jgi:hypothetical protein